LTVACSEQFLLFSPESLSKKRRDSLATADMPPCRTPVAQAS
jgi:hypothetical protein